jgi:2,5-diketo-D-gluconate reductase A
MAALATLPKRELGDGNTMPTLGFGTFCIPDEEAEGTVGSAFRVGYRHIDTAEFYKNEAGVGRAVAACGLERADVFITTKLDPGNPAWGQAVKTFDTTIAACKESLSKLGVSQIDLYLIHTPLSGKEARLDQWKALLECQRLGLCKSIGVSNYDIGHIQEIEEAGLPMPAANQLELHPMCQKAALLEHMRVRKILPIAYSSLAPLSSWREGYSAFGGSKADAAKATPSPVAGIAARLSVSEARVLLRYAVQKGWAILPKSVREERMRDNADLASFDLSAEDMAELDAMESGAAFAFGAQGQAFDPTKVA